MADKILSASAKQRNLTEFNILKNIKVKCKECGNLMLRRTEECKWYYFCKACMRDVYIEMPEYIG